MFSFLKTNLQKIKSKQYLVEHSVTEVIGCLSTTVERRLLYNDK